MACLKLVCAIVLCMVVLAPKASEAVIASCAQVNPAIIPCTYYLYNGGNVTKACCASLTQLNNTADDTYSRRLACACLKADVSSVVATGANDDNAVALPGKCNITLPFNISSSADCQSVN